MKDNLKKILVVDDSKEDLKLIVNSLLQETSFHVEQASDGDQGLETFKKSGPFDIVITDLIMPNMNGIELLVELRKIVSKEETIIIVITGSLNMEEKKKGLELGLNAWMVKPINQDVLRNVLKKHKMSRVHACSRINSSKPSQDHD